MSDVHIGKFKKRLTLDEEPSVIEADDLPMTIRVSSTYALIGDRYVPEWVEVTVRNPTAPVQFARVELRDEVPQCVALRFESAPDCREVRQADLRTVEISALCVDLVAGLSAHVDLSQPGKTIIRPGIHDASWGETLRLLERQRRGPGLRDITPELLAEVAKVYRENIDRAPTQAVAKTFGVRSRMASTYVQKARERGLLPPTKQGKKQA